MGKGDLNNKSNDQWGAHQITAAPAAANLPMTPMPIKTQGSLHKLIKNINHGGPSVEDHVGLTRTLPITP